MSTPALFLRALEAPAGVRRLAWGLLPVFLLLLFPTGQLGSNEEHSLQRAYLFIQPMAFTDDHAIFGESTTRIASDILIGYPVAWLGYDGAVVLLRLANAVLFAIGFAVLVAPWTLSLLDGVLVLGAFWLMGQQLVGGEWLFQDIEGKTFAYGLVMLGLGLAFRRKWWQADLCFAAATYLHLLVGGFWFLFALAFRLALGDRGKAVTAQLLRYALATLPLLVAVIVEQSATLSQKGTYSSAWIYSMLRNAHHVAPFSDPHILWAWTPGLVSALGLLAALCIAGRASERSLRALLLCVAGVLLFLFLALGATWLDRDSGVLGPFFLFRPGSLALLLGLLGLWTWAQRSLGVSLRTLKWVIVAWLVPVFLWAAVKGKVEEAVGNADARAQLAELIEVVQAHSSESDPVLLQPGRDGALPEVSLPRRLERPTYVSWKFVPTAPADLLRWYERVQRRETLFATACRDKAGLEPRLLIGWTTAWDAQLADCGEVLWRSERYWVIGVR